MKKQNNLLKRGFSLIELSIVILIIGILVVGITRGTAIISKTRTSAARSLTAGSPAPTIPGLTAWFETSSESSFAEERRYDALALDENTDGISWFDNSPNKNLNATTVTGNPTYREITINNLPGIRFDGTDDAIAFNTASLNGRSFTVFVVEQRRAATGNFLSFDSTNNVFGYATDTSIDMTSGTGTVAVSAYSQPIPRIITFLASSATYPYTQGIFINGGAGSVAADGTITPTATTASGSIGSNGYTGDICEVIIYNRALTLAERNDIQEYLSKKYAIRVTKTES